MIRTFCAPFAAAAAIGLAWPATGAPSQTPMRASVPLPGGAAALSAAVGSPRVFDRAFVLIEAARLLHETPPGENPEADLRRRAFDEYVKTVGTATSADDAIPLPLTPALWSDAILHQRVRDRDVALAILADRQASFLYVGLAALDDETLTALASDRRLLQTLYQTHAAVFAAFAGSFRVRDGVVQVPGGGEARPLWEGLAKQPVTEPPAFLLALLAADAGRLAFFYDTAAQLDTRARRYVLAFDEPAETRLARVQALYRVLAASQPGWQVARRPFTRASIDASLLFRALRLDDRGAPLGPMWPELLGRALEDLPGAPPTGGGGAWLPVDPARDVAEIDPSRRVDPAWIAERILRPLPPIGRQRLDALLFGQRVFPRPDPKDAADILLALRGRIVFPTLVMTLERMGAREPALYARAVRHAAPFLAVGSPGDAVSALAGLQGCLVILERSVREHTLAPADALALAADLFALQPDASQRYRGAIAQWFDRKLLPALWHATGETVASSSAESVVLKAIAGDVLAPERPPVLVEWEGRPYHVNRGAAEFARLKALRETQGGDDLDRVLDLSRTLADARKADSANESVIADMVAVREALRGLAPPVLAPRAGLGIPDALASAETAVDRANARDRAGAIAALEPLVGYADALLADALTSIVYALALGPPDSPALTSGNVALRHDFGVLRPRTLPWQVPPGWALPAEDPQGGWHADGSLLGLDLGLSRLGLRWLAAHGMPSMPLLNANERRTFADSVALLNPFDLTDADRDRLVAALDVGHERLLSLASDPRAIDRLADDARLSATRREALRWMLVHDRTTAGHSLSLLEEFWLGAEGAPAPDAWGVSALPTTGCACPAFPEPDAWEAVAGRPASGLLGTRLPDLTLRVAQELKARGLPAALAPGILAIAMNDLLHEARPAHHDDWPAIVSYVRSMASERFGDYVSSLTAAGPLVPALAARDGGAGR